MKKLKIKSLTIRIWMTFTSAILIIVMCISLIYLFIYRKINEEGILNDLKVSHSLVSYNLLNGNSYNAPNGFDDFKNLKGSKHFVISTKNNQTNINDVDPGGKPHPTPPIGEENRIKEWMGRFTTKIEKNEESFEESYGNNDYIFVISSINKEGTAKAYLVSYVLVIQDYTIVYTVLSIGVIFIIIGFFASKMIANYISKPLQKLEWYTKKIATKDWKEPIIIDSDDEIGRLADSMNTMRKELKRADEEEKMFLQSISHDLKTPVMVIMSHADAIIDGVYIESVEKTAEIIKDEAISLDKKIKQILYLNTLNYVMENNREVHEFNLNDLLIHIINRFEVVNSKIEWHIDTNDVFIRGNADQIQVAIENILENGLRYVESKISITLKEENSFVVLDIYNDGPSINDEHIDHIFDNLYKDKTGNFGLGLAITKKVIDFYNGDIRAVNKDKGVSFIIKLEK